MKKNALLTFIFACIPGAGQMYYGYMRRGLSLVTLFCVASGIGVIIPPILLATPIIWMYAFFDTYDLIRYLVSGNPKPDDFIWGDRIDLGRFKTFTPRGNRIIGWVLVACGVWVLFDSWVAPILHDVFITLGIEYLYYNLVGQLPTIIVAGLLIYFGIRLLGRSGGNNSANTMPPYPGEFRDGGGDSQDMPR